MNTAYVVRLSATMNLARARCAATMSTAYAVRLYATMKLMRARWDPPIRFSLGGPAYKARTVPNIRIALVNQHVSLPQHVWIHFFYRRGGVKKNAVMGGLA